MQACAEIDVIHKGGCMRDMWLIGLVLPAGGWVQVITAGESADKETTLPQYGPVSVQ